MRIAIDHITHYRFASPARHGLQRLRLTPRGGALQSVIDWQVSVEGGTIEAAYDDHNLNPVTLVAFGAETSAIAVRCRGVVETHDKAGVYGRHTGCMPLWAFAKQTPLTRPGARMGQLAGRFRAAGDQLPMLHDLSHAVRGAVAYEAGRTNAETTAEAALAAGHGVCQDHAHIFIGAARILGIPARYVSGYLLVEGGEEEVGSAPQASHGWAEAHVAGLGWVGFDVSNGVCPDERYVRLAVGADYHDAAPITGMSQGAGAGALEVSLQVAQSAAGQ